MVGEGIAGRCSKEGREIPLSLEVSEISVTTVGETEGSVEIRTGVGADEEIDISGEGKGARIGEGPGRVSSSPKSDTSVTLDIVGVFSGSGGRAGYRTGSRSGSVT